MTPPFSVTATPHFERVFRKLLAGHPELRAIRERVGEILKTDPTNRTGRYHIKKLKESGIYFRLVTTHMGPRASQIVKAAKIE